MSLPKSFKSRYLNLPAEPHCFLRNGKDNGANTTTLPKLQVEKQVLGKNTGMPKLFGDPERARTQIHFFPWRASPRLIQASIQL